MNALLISSLRRGEVSCLLCPHQKLACDVTHVAESNALVVTLWHQR
jgi:hypothetical protein